VVASTADMSAADMSEAFAMGGEWRHPTKAARHGPGKTGP
jgi:hypothetical protein